MPVKPKYVSTAADDLLVLIKREGELSFQEAARRLGVPQQTIEAWANFLEEEGVLSIKYKFTTPYLMPAKEEQKGEKQKNDEEFREKLGSAEAKSDLASAKELLEEMEQQRAEGELGKLSKAFMDLLKKLNSVYEFLAQKKGLTEASKGSIKAKLDSLQREIYKGEELVGQSRFDMANSVYSKVDGELRKLYDSMKSTYSVLVESQTVKESNVRELLERAYKAMETGNLEEAQRYYDALSSLYSNVSEEYLSKKQELQEHILKLNKDIAASSARMDRETVIELGKKIEAMLNAANNSIRSRDFRQAIAYYSQIKKAFEEFPPGFVREKRALQEKIIRLYEQVSHEREKKLRSKFDAYAKQIEALLKDTSQQIKEGKVSMAMSTYQKLRSIFYNGLPSGFLKEKTMLQSMILPVYSALARNYEASEEMKLSKAKAEIESQIAEMRQLVNAGKLGEAKQKYAEIKRTYASMPEGFLQEETELQDKTLDAYEELLEQENRQTSSSSRNAMETMNSMLGSAAEELRMRNFDRANAVYQRIKEAYIQLPPMDMKEKAVIRNRILSFYRSLLMLRTVRKDELPAAQPLRHPEPNAATHQEISSRINELKSASRAKVRMPLAQ